MHHLTAERHCQCSYLLWRCGQLLCALDLRLRRVCRTGNTMLRFALRLLFCLQTAAGGEATVWSVLLTGMTHSLLPDIEFVL